MAPLARIEAGVGAADDDPGHELGARVGDLGTACAARPTAGCPRRSGSTRTPGSARSRRGRRQLAERLGEVAVDDLPGVAGHRADVDVDVDDVGDDVGLLAAVDDVGRDGRVGAGVGDAGVVGRQRRERRPACVVGSSSAVAQVVGQVDRRDPGLPQVVELRRRPERGEPADDLGRLDQRVVGAVGHRAVAGRAVDAQAAPGDALLGDVDRDVAGAVVADRSTSRPTR